MLETEGIGKNLEQAIENALFELKAPREDVDIKILSEGGLFKKARVLVSISEDAKEKYIKRVEKKIEDEVSVIVDVDKSAQNVEEIEKALKKDIAKKEAKREIEKTFAKKEEVETEDDGDEDDQNEESGMDAVEFLTGLLDKAGKSGYTIETKEDDKYITYCVKGENLGDLIGHRGECFYAISRLLVAVVGKTDKKVLLDIGEYREKRVESLTALAKRTADRVAKSGKYARLDPMNPSDRRIIHTALQDDARVTTFSKGVEPRRYVLVFPADTDN